MTPEYVQAFNEDEIQKRNERALEEAAKRSREQGGKWVTLEVGRPDGTTGSLRLRSKSEHKIEVKPIP